MPRRSDTHRDMVLVSRQELQHLRDELADLEQRLEYLARKRFDVKMLLTRLDGVLNTASDPDKTPVRPPSSDALKAFQVASEYTRVNPKDPRKD